MIVLQEHDIVVLLRSLPEHDLHAGDVGVIVSLYVDPSALEVEFVDGGGHTLALVTLEAADVRALQAGEILHARSLAA